MKEMESQAKLSLKLQAYQYLKTKILNCEYRPNEFLNEQKLCAEMGNISRTPMRDALGRLEQEGEMELIAALLSGDETTFKLFRTQAPELVHLPDATYEWYCRHYLDRYYPVRFILHHQGIEFPRA